MSRSYRFLVLALVALALVVAGCAKPEEKYIGTYVGKQQLSQKALDMLSKLPQATKDQIENSQITLVLKKDKSSTMSATGQVAVINGTWSYSNGQVVIAFANSGQPMKLNPSSDGKTLTPDMSAVPNSDQYGTLTFTRQ